MKFRFFTILAILALLVAGMGANLAFAQAYTTSFITSITYMNVGSSAAQISILFYADPSSTIPIVVPRPDLPTGAGTSLFIGSLAQIGTGFRGSAVMQSSEPLLATMVQLPQGSATVKNRPLSNGFSSGEDQSLIATVLKNQFDTNSIFSVQNVDTLTNNISIKFYNTSASLIHTINQTVEPGAAFYVDAGTVSQLGSSFNGSVVVTAERTDTSNGSIIASAMELSISGASASAFEGVGSGSAKFYMPSALCNAFGGTNTSYAVQNTSLTTPTSVTVTYSNGATQTQPIQPGAKASFIACNAAGMTQGFSGAATVESTATPVIAIGKAFGLGLSTAFVGASSGSSDVGLPYVRWASNTNWANGSQQRVNLTIQNIGTTDIPASQVTVDYVDKNGNVLGTHTLGSIPAGDKLNSNASNAGLAEFGVYPDGSFGGGAIVHGPSGSQLAVVARVTTQVSPGSFASEDYNGMEIPTP